MSLYQATNWWILIPGATGKHQGRWLFEGLKCFIKPTTRHSFWWCWKNNSSLCFLRPRCISLRPLSLPLCPSILEFWCSYWDVGSSIFSTSFYFWKAYPPTDPPHLSPHQLYSEVWDACKRNKRPASLSKPLPLEVSSPFAANMPLDATFWMGFFNPPGRRHKNQPTTSSDFIEFLVTRPEARGRPGGFLKPHVLQTLVEATPHVETYFEKTRNNMVVFILQKANDLRFCPT